MPEKLTAVKLPDWLEARYRDLWGAFQKKQFSLEDAAEELKKHKDTKKEVSVILSELKNAGWLFSEPDPLDRRKRIYTLRSTKDIVGSALSVNGSKLTRPEVDALLKKAADLIRTRVDYKFILILLFLKRISDKWELEYENAKREALEDGFSEDEAEEEAKNAAYHDFDYPEEYLWDNLRKDVNKLSENFSQALKTLSEKNPVLKDVLDNVDFIQFTSSRENAEILRQLVELFSEKKLHHVSADILGDAYEWILSYFAPQKAKEGEVYTPREVIKLLVEILDPQPGESVYDPASASNGMLIVAYKHVEEAKGKKEANKLFLHGQEANQKTLALGRMNLYIHDIKNANIAYGDTLLYPKSKEADGVKQFDIVIANPPWNQDGYEEEVLKKGDFYKKRFPYGPTTKQSADWAWIQHMLASAKDNPGRVGVVIDNGCLFRSGAEKSIRSQVLEKDLVECVILLPEKLFYNTGAPGAIIIFNKNKSAERKGKVLFINASAEYGKHPDVRKLNHLADDNIQHIVEAYREFKDQPGFTTVASLDEIKENDDNLNVTLYAYPEQETEQIDIAQEWRELKQTEETLKAVDEKIEGYLEEIYEKI
jgi:type I restriction enzyme M protein